ncbi:MAG: radical SAM protein [Alphaproteobacteria bacterium]|nr:radical SAM protein [Alphaproteobacteria bacterium]
MARAVAEDRADLSGGRPVRTAVRAAALEGFDRHDLEVIERIEDPTDGSLRYLFRCDDGALVEAVRIPLLQPGHFTVCLSSQAGCAMACDFCATGRLGFGRNLRAWEIVAQLMVVRREAPGRVTGAVFMGQGEPFHNYDAVIQAARVLAHPCGGRVAQKAITISTVGLVPQIRRFTAEGHRFRLIVSMTSAIQERRRGLLPVAGRWDLAELADALRAHHEATGARVTVAWVLLGGVNTDPAEVEALAALLDGVPFKINLIDVNDARADGYRRASDAERDAFIDALQALRVPVVRRFSVGRGRHSACGMLASRRLAELQDAL